MMIVIAVIEGTGIFQGTAFQAYRLSAGRLLRPAHDAALTTMEFISNLARSLPIELGVETYVVHEGEIVEHYRPPQSTADPSQV